MQKSLFDNDFFVVVCCYSSSQNRSYVSDKILTSPYAPDWLFENSKYTSLTHGIESINSNNLQCGLESQLSDEDVCPTCFEGDINLYLLKHLICTCLFLSFLV